MAKGGVTIQSEDCKVPEDYGAVIQRWIQAMNSHDLEAAVSCFHADYVDETPVHPSHTFRGQTQVRENFSTLFDSVKDLQAEVLRSVVDKGTVWIEWTLRGTRTDNSQLHMAGVNLFGISNNQIIWGRIYTEPVSDEMESIETRLREMTGKEPK